MKPVSIKHPENYFTLDQTITVKTKKKFYKFSCNLIYNVNLFFFYSNRITKFGFHCFVFYKSMNPALVVGVLVNALLIFAFCGNI